MKMWKDRSVLEDTHMLSAKRTQGIGTKQLLALRKPLIIEANWGKKHALIW